MLCGNLVAILGGGAITLVVSLLTNHGLGATESEEVWENTRDIDNPLSPWVEKYRKELQLTDTRRLDNRPSLQDVQKAFKISYTIAYSMSLLLTLFLIVLWPSIMVSVTVMNLAQFTAWVKFSESWAFLAALLMMILPLCNEFWDIWTVFNQTKKIDPMEFVVDDDVEADRKPLAPNRHNATSSKKEKNDDQPKDREPDAAIFAISSHNTIQQEQPSAGDLQPVPPGPASGIRTNEFDAFSQDFERQETIPNGSQGPLSTLPSTFIDLGSIEKFNELSKRSHAQHTTATAASNEDTEVPQTTPPAFSSKDQPVQQLQQPQHQHHQHQHQQQRVFDDDDKPSSPIPIARGQSTKYFSDILHKNDSVETRSVGSNGPSQNILESNDSFC